MKSVAVLALATAAIAAPATKRQAAGINDADILQYALTLEHLEDTFYRTALQNYSQSAFAAQGFGADIYNNIKTVASDEKTHVAFLTAGLTAAGAMPVAECTYAFPVTDPQSFLATASILEGVGVSAYLGAAADIMNKTYLTDAGSILTVESRHSAYIRNALAEVPFPSPFDIPLDFDEVYSLASQFIVSCPPSNAKLPVKAFPVLAASPGKATPGSKITVTSKTPLSGKVYAAFATVTGPVYADIASADNGAGSAFTITVPSGNPLIMGQNYITLQKDCSGTTDENVLAGPAIVEVYN